MKSLTPFWKSVMLATFLASKIWLCGKFFSIWQNFLKNWFVRKSFLFIKAFIYSLSTFRRSSICCYALSLNIVLPGKLGMLEAKVLISLSRASKSEYLLSMVHYLFDFTKPTTNLKNTTFFPSSFFSSNVGISAFILAAWLQIFLPSCGAAV